MNRELKFRAYDKVEKEMLTILEMDWYPDHTLRYLKATDEDDKEWYYDSPDDVTTLVGVLGRLYYYPPM